MKTRGKIIWSMVGLFVLVIGISVAIDAVKHSKVVSMPSRPAESLGGSFNDVLYAFTNNIDMPQSELQHHIDEVCRYVDGRYDCADFRLVSLIRVLYLYPEKLSATQHEQIKTTLLNFKYWLDEPGDDSMCYWSENHQILFAQAEYLIGKLYPNDIFTNMNITGIQRMERGRERILTWLEQRWNYGFTEWYSTVYYVEDIAPLSNLADFADDPEIITKTQIIMDLLWYDVASQSYQGVFIPTSGRAYEGKRKTGNDSSMKAAIQHVWGYDLGAANPRGGMLLNFIYAQNYHVPEAIRQVGYDHEPKVIKASNGLNVAELKGEGLIGLENPQVMMQWAMESFTNPEIVNNTIDIINTYNLHAQSSFKDFSLINYWALRRLGLLPLVVKIINPQSHGNAIQRANTYTYRTENYTMSTTQSYHPGTYGDQHHVFQATLNNELAIFNSHPAVWQDDRGPNGNSPRYWVGYGHLPHSVQDINVNLSLYQLPEKKGMMEKRLIDYTHAWFPENLFDEVVVEDTHIFGRTEDTYVGIKTFEPVLYVNPEHLARDGSGTVIADTTTARDTDNSGASATSPRQEVVQHGKNTYWITEISTKIEEGSFDAFMHRIRGNVATYDQKAGQLVYTTGNRTLDLTFGGDFRVNGALIETEHDRFDSPYVQAPRKPETLTIEWNGHSLFLDFYGMQREEF